MVESLRTKFPSAEIDWKGWLDWQRGLEIFSSSLFAYLSASPALWNRAHWMITSNFIVQFLYTTSNHHQNQTSLRTLHYSQTKKNYVKTVIFASIYANNFCFIIINSIRKKNFLHANYQYLLYYLQTNLKQFTIKIINKKKKLRGLSHQNILPVPTTVAWRIISAIKRVIIAFYFFLFFCIIYYLSLK